MQATEPPSGNFLLYVYEVSGADDLNTRRGTRENELHRHDGTLEGVVCHNPEFGRLIGGAAGNLGINIIPAGYLEALSTGLTPAEVDNYRTAIAAVEEERARLWKSGKRLFREGALKIFKKSKLRPTGDLSSPIDSVLQNLKLNNLAIGIHGTPRGELKDTGVTVFEILEAFPKVVYVVSGASDMATLVLGSSDPFNPYRIDASGGERFIAGAGIGLGFTGFKALRYGDEVFDVVNGVRRIAPKRIGAKSWQQYERGVRDIYGDVPFAQRQYQAIVDGKLVNGVADNVATIGGKNVAIEAKFVTSSWSNSIRNPQSAIGTKPFSKAERWKMVNQAKKYSAAFDEVIYHTNDLGLMNQYNRVFQKFGLDNVHFIHTP